MGEWGQNERLLRCLCYSEDVDMKTLASDFVTSNNVFSVQPLTRKEIEDITSKTPEGRN